MKQLTRREAQHAMFGRNDVAERQHAGHFRVEKLMAPRFGEEPQWILMSAGEADATAPAGKELDLLKRRATVLEGTTRIISSKTGEVVWPPKALQ